MTIHLPVDLHPIVETHQMVIMSINIGLTVNFTIRVSKIEHIITQLVNMVIVFPFNINGVYQQNKLNVPELS